MAKKHGLIFDRKKIRLSRAIAVVRRNLCRAYSLPLKSKDPEIFAIDSLLGQLDALHTQNLDKRKFRIAAIQILGFQCKFQTLIVT
jgi:hypothetical protein